MADVTPLSIGLMLASYYDPTQEQVVKVVNCSTGDIDSLLRKVLKLWAGRAYPTLELARDDGSRLDLATDGGRAFVLFVNSRGESFHSTGGSDGEPWVFDYFGAWGEVPADWVVSLDQALKCAEAFALVGTVDAGHVRFEPE